MRSVRLHAGARAEGRRLLLLRGPKHAQAQGKEVLHRSDITTLAIIPAPITQNVGSLLSTHSPGGSFPFVAVFLHKAYF